MEAWYKVATPRKEVRKGGTLLLSKLAIWVHCSKKGEIGKALVETGTLMLSERGAGVRQAIVIKYFLFPLFGGGVAAMPVSSFG